MRRVLVVVVNCRLRDVVRAGRCTSRRAVVILEKSRFEISRSVVILVAVRNRNAWHSRIRLCNRSNREFFGCRRRSFSQPHDSMVGSRPRPGRSRKRSLRGNLCKRGAPGIADVTLGQRRPGAWNFDYYNEICCLDVICCDMI